MASQGNDRRSGHFVRRSENRFVRARQSAGTMEPGPVEANRVCRDALIRDGFGGEHASCLSVVPCVSRVSIISIISITLFISWRRSSSVRVRPSHCSVVYAVFIFPVVRGWLWFLSAPGSECPAIHSVLSGSCAADITSFAGTASAFNDSVSSGAASSSFAAERRLRARTSLKCTT